MRIGIFIPAYDEKDTVVETIKKIRKMYPYYELVVIDDGSTDGTGAMAKNLGVRVFTHPKNKGLGAGTRSGLKLARELNWDICVKTDMDLQHPIEAIKDVVRPILDDEADLVLGNRFGGKILYKMPFYKRVGNAFFTLAIRTLTGLNIDDAQTGLIACNSRYLEKFKLLSNYNETQQMILECWKNDLRIKEVPIDFYPRKSGKSFISLKYPFIVIPSMLRIYTHTLPLRIFVPIGLLLVVFGLYTLLLDEFWDMAFLSGVIILFMGVLADIIAK